MRVADNYPTEFSAGVAQGVGAEGQFGAFFLHRSEDDLVVGEIGGQAAPPATLGARHVGQPWVDFRAWPQLIRTVADSLDPSAGEATVHAARSRLNAGVVGSV